MHNKNIQTLVFFILGILLSAGLGFGMEKDMLTPLLPAHLRFSLLAMPYVYGASFFLSFLTVVGIFLQWLRPFLWWSWLMLTALTGGLIVLASIENYLVMEVGYVAMSNLYEVSRLLFVTTGLVGLMFTRERTSLLPALLPLFVLETVAQLWLHSINQHIPQELVPALHSFWLPWHVVANFIGYGCFMVAAGAALITLFSPNIPLRHHADTLAYRAISLGFPVFTLAIFLGSVWAYEAWGGYWSWDPKETWALIVWLTYAGYLHARLQHGWSEKRLAIWALLAFFVTLFCYWGVNMWLGGLHSYGQIQ